MTDCSQLQALLDGAQQERQALDDPETYCQDQCDPGDVGCIKQCLRNIPARKQELDQEIANLQLQLQSCSVVSSLLTGTWIYNDDGARSGRFEIAAVFNDGSWSGTVFPSELLWCIHQPETFYGTWNETQLKFSFSLSCFGIDATMDLNTQPLTMTGQFSDPFNTEHLWTATKSS